MGMCVQKIKAVVVLTILVVLACLCGCEPMDTILPSSGSYKVNASINGAALDELSFFASGDKIQPYFEEAVSKDPDVTALVVFLKNARGNTVGWKVTYTLEPIADGETNTNDDVSSDDLSDNLLEDLDSDQITSANDPEDTEEDLEEDLLSSGEEEDLTPVVTVNDRTQPAPNTDSSKDGEELIIIVKSLDGELPVFPLPNNLPVGRYTLVSHVMSGKDILQKIEKSVYYMGRAVFSYDGIQVHMPGIAESSQVIPKGMVVLLETSLNFNRRLNPYIVWYNGRRKIGEGLFSEGAGRLLWKAPEQSGFYSLRAEVFPVNNFDGLVGYKKDISLLVSSKDIDVNLVSENIAELLHWYTFEGNLNDSKLISSADLALKPYAKNVPQWAGRNGTYGLITGTKDIFSLPRVPVLNNGTETWQALFRFNPLNDGVILSVQFDNSRDVYINLKVEDHNLVLELVSPLETVSQIYPLPQLSGSAEQPVSSEQSASTEQPVSSEQSVGQSNPAGQDPAELGFIKAGFVFSILPEMLAANINVVGNRVDRSEFNEKWACLDVEIESGFQMLLGQRSVNDDSSEAVKKSDYTAIWDEFALYFMPPIEIFGAYEEEAVDEEKPQEEELQPSAD